MTTRKQADTAKRFEGKVALVTGGASGIGLATARALAMEGARLLIADIDEEAGEKAAQEIGKLGTDCEFVSTDVANVDDVRSLIRRASEAFGQLDCAFNHAGIVGTPVARVSQCTEDNWDRVLRTNLKGTWLCLKYEIKAMRKGGTGSIVCAASAAAMGGSFANAAYTVAKHGVVGLTKSAAIECAEKNIRVNAICPGYIESPMTERLTRLAHGVGRTIEARTPMRRLGTTEEVVRAVLWLLSDESSFVTGHALAVDGGILAS